MICDTRNKQYMWRRYFLTLVVIILAFVFAFTNQTVKVYTDWLWYKEIGEESFFYQYFYYQWGMALGAFVTVLGVIGFNLWFAVKLVPQGVRIEGGIIELPLFALLPLVNTMLWGIAIFLAFIAGGWGYANWQFPVLFLHGDSFGIIDPLFQKDAAFYVFKLPYLLFLYRLLIISLIASFIGTTIIYVFAKGIGLTLRGLRLLPKVLVHLSILLAIIFLIRGSGYILQMYELLYSSHGIIWGPGYSDLYGRIPIFKFLFIVAVIGSLIILFNIKFKNWKLPLIVLGIWGVISLIGMSYPKFIQQFQVIPNELVLEEPFIRNHIDMTRKAYQLDRVKVEQFTPKTTLNLNSLEQEEGILKNIRLWDHVPLLTTYAQLQEIRPYYKFLDVDIDRYIVNGLYRQVMLSARELSHEHLQSRSWVNEHLVYTHGYGAVVSPVNQISEEGLPEFFIKDIPPVSATDIQIKRPEIYFGELSNSYVLVNTRQQEFDYPAGEENMYTHYQGKGGVPIGNLWQRFVFALRFSTLRLLLSSDLTSDSRIMYMRSLKERLTHAFPLLVYDEDPYLVIHDGKLFWISDAYTITRQFPYAAPFSGNAGNYIRNSVKVLVDAYEGKVTYYISDMEDPIIRTYAKLFPGLFHNLSDMPLGLRAHLRYPEDFFRVQSEMYTLYHMKTPRVFYNKEDVWHLPRISEGREPFMDPYYTTMKFRGSSKEEFIQMIPFTPAKKDNLSAWMTARSDFPNYGELVVYIFPKQELVFGPMQISARINQDPAISQLLTLWGQQGSSVIRGQLQVIPVGSSLLYVQPLYLKSDRGQLPELKRVIVSYGTAIAMEETLEKALKRVLAVSESHEKFSESSNVTFDKRRQETTTENEKLWRQAREHYERAVKFQREGNWTGYGEEVRSLGELLHREMERKKTK